MALRPKERQGLLRLSGERQEDAWPGLAELAERKLDPDTLDVDELKQRFLVVQAVEAARTMAEHVVTDPREADVGSILGFGFAPFTGGTISYIDGMGVKAFVELCDALDGEIRPALRAAAVAARNGGERRNLLRALRRPGASRVKQQRRRLKGGAIHFAAR